MNGENKNVLCFGEVLWDVLPAGRKPGGAPMNVAYHLNRLGIKSQLISRVGNDEAGSALLDFLTEIAVPTAQIQLDDMQETSKVLASMDADKEMTYNILEPVAWDFIAYEPGLTGLVADAAVFVYGRLAARNKTSLDTLMALLERANYRMFDVNLRYPHYTKPLLDMLLAKADAIKLNMHELAIISEWLGNVSGSESTAVGLLQDLYGLQEIIVTKGAAGASYYTPSSRHEFDGVPVEVMDTVGSGDSFLAAFLAQRLQGESIENALELASFLGAYIATKAGACPFYTRDDLNSFIRNKNPDKK